MKIFFNIFLWVIFFLLLAPSSMALASWNAVPGDYTYSWKIVLENALLLVLSPSDKLQTSTHVKLTERRFNEVQTVLSREDGQVSESLGNFTEQMKLTTTNISEMDKAENKVVLTEQYIESLNEIMQELEEEQSVRKLNNTSIITNNYNNTGTVTSPTVSNSNPVTGINPTSVPIPTVTPTTPSEEELDDEIEETKDEIEEIIEELEDLKQESLNAAESQNSERNQERNTTKEQSQNVNDEKDNRDKAENSSNSDKKTDRNKSEDSEDSRMEDSTNHRENEDRD